MSALPVGATANRTGALVERVESRVAGLDELTSRAKAYDRIPATNDQRFYECDMVQASKKAEVR